MKKNIITVLCLLFSLQFCFSNNPVEWTKNFETGSVELSSINSITFGPDGILFVGDSKSALIYALDTRDTKSPTSVDDVSIKEIDEKIAGLLGLETNSFEIRDLAVNPISKAIYLAIQTEDGSCAILRVANGKIKPLPLVKISHSKTRVQDALAEDAKDQRGRDLRKWTISDMKFEGGKLMFSGLSNREFKSTFSSIPFPFDKRQSAATLEIYHAAHGRFETYAPIKTFTTARLNGQDHLVASYTCTPLVIFPMDELVGGKHVKGRTLAELGNRNTPLDIINAELDGESFVLMSNTSRALMKISYKHMEMFGTSLKEKVAERSGTAGVDFIALPLVNVLQLDKLDKDRFVMLQRRANGDLDLYSSKFSRWL